MITSREMRALETTSEYYGVSRLQLMENAGRSVADHVRNRFKPAKTRVVVLCGLGGNGGDGFVATRHLLNYGFRVEVVLAGKSVDITDKDARVNWNALQRLKDYVAIIIAMLTTTLLPILILLLILLIAVLLVVAHFR